MRKLFYVLFIAALFVAITSCSKDNNPAATTTVATTTTTVSTTATSTGTGSLPAGVNGSIQNTRVALYTSLNNWNFDITFAFTACDANGGYTMSGLVPGNYFMDAWKDLDNDQVWGSSGDYVWIYGSGSYPNYTLAERSFPAGAPVVTDFTIFIVP